MVLGLNPGRGEITRKNLISNTKILLPEFLANTSCRWMPGSSVGIATDYGMDSPGSNPGGDEIFCPSRPAFGPTQPPAQWVPGFTRR